jgi:hypothetical protein
MAGPISRQLVPLARVAAEERMMNDTLVSIVVFAVLGIIVSLVLRIRLRSAWVHIPTSAALTSALFQVILFFRLGHWEMFALVAFIGGIFAAALIAAIVYVLTMKDRDPATPQPGSDSGS